MRKFFTLVELIIVVVIIGILSVIVIPNISSMKTDATQAEILGNKTNIQTAVDTITLSEKEVPTVSGGKATLGNPQKVDLKKIAPEYIRNLPNKNANYWVDYQGVIYGSLSELPSNPKVTDSGFVSWEETKGSHKYKVYKKNGDAQSSAQGYKFDVITELEANSNPDGKYSYKGEEGQSYFIISEDELGNETPLVGPEYTKLMDLDIKTMSQEFREEGTISITPSSKSLGVKPYKYSYLDKEYEGETLNFDVNKSGTYDVVVHFLNGETKELSIEIDVDLEVKTKNYSFEGDEQGQIQKFDLKNLFEVISVNSDNGDVNIISVENDTVTVELTNGDVSREDLVSGEYIPEETRKAQNSVVNSTNKFDASIKYDKDGFKGTLQKDGKSTSKVVSGKYEEEKTKEVTNQPSKDYNKDGFKGTLSKYVHSGELIKEENKTENATRTSSKDSFPSTVSYDKDGFKGTLNKSGGSTSKVISGEYKKEETKQVTNQPSKDYNKDGFKGTLSKYVHSGEYKPEEKRTENATRTSSKDSFPSTVSYDKGGFKGTLNKAGGSTSKVISGEYKEKETKQVTNQPSKDYNKDGFKGTLERYVHSGSYTPEHSRNQEFSWYISNPTIKINGLINRNVTETREYPNGASTGYYGTLSLKNVEKTRHKDAMSVNYTVTYFFDSKKWGDQIIEENESGIAQEFEESFGKNNPDENGDYYQNPKLVSSEYKSPIRVGSFEYEGKDYPYQREVLYKMTVDGFTYRAYYEGTVTRPASDTRVYRYKGTVVKPEVDTRVYEYTQKYSGTVTKPEVDTRVFRYKGTVVKPEVDTRVYEYTQKYSGTVTKPEKDTRVFRYKGTVVKPEVDTRVYEYTQKYSGTVTKPEKDTRVYKDIYEYNLEVEYK